MTKDEISHEETRSKIGHHRVQKEKFERTSLFLCCGVGDRSTQSRGRSVGGGVAKLSLVGDYCYRNLLSLTDDCL